MAATADSSDSSTVLGLLKRLFPSKGEGSPPYWQWPLTAGDALPDDKLGSYANLPLVPFDAFAIAAYLLEASGAYHHIVAQPDGSTGEPVYRSILVSSDDIADARRIAKIWREDYEKLGGDVAARYQRQFADLRSLADDWRRLFSLYGSQPVFRRLGTRDKPPEWWRIAHKILMVADDACVGVGFKAIHNDASRADMPWFERFYYGNTLKQTYVNGIKSFSHANTDVACVLPKARTTPVGCTLRSLSHHLALAPPRGVSRGRWRPPQPGLLPTDDREFNFLLIPFPFSIDDKAFVPHRSKAHPSHGWGFFEVDQTWLPRPADVDLFAAQMVALVMSLKKISEAKGARSIDGIIFPELALNHNLATRLAFLLKVEIPELELFISGLGDHGARRGNFVGVWNFEKDSKGLVHDTTTREKHHRWKLDRAQIANYVLDGALNPKLMWWENLELLSRRVDFTVFRERSVLAAMICEDLARVDPCQTLVRSVGPNLVIALLMDAPQRPDRWPARYATVLAEDPGCSVLTFTSRGLMTRQHEADIHPSKSGKDRIVGLWKDDFHGRPKEIHCPLDAQGVWLKLWSSQVTDFTLDGRDDNHGKTWVYGKHEPLSVTNADQAFAAILGQADCRIVASLRKLNP